MQECTRYGEAMVEKACLVMQHHLKSDVLPVCVGQAMAKAALACMRASVRGTLKAQAIIQSSPDYSSPRL